MLEINLIRTEPDFVKERLKVKNFKQLELVDEVIALDAERRRLQQVSEAAQHESKSISKEIPMLYKQGKGKEAERLKLQASSLKDNIKDYLDDLKVVEEKLHNALIVLPNLPHESVAMGNGADDNEVVKEHGTHPDLGEDAKPHWELFEQYNIVSLELGTKIAGAGFPVFIGKGARLQRAMINFFLDEAIKAGYQEYMPPLMVNEASAYATGQLPDKEGQMYHVTADDLFLIPTAEVPLTNIYRDTIVKEEDFPIKLVGYTPCFRREAGSYGAHVRGLNRVHQFEKVEIVQLAHPEKSYEVLEQMVQHVESILQKLGLPYRILRLCGGDATFTSALTYDFETYSAAQKRWLEVSSVSNFETFQANRMMLRFRDNETKKMRLAHTLNGSALALARIVATVLENNQTPDGIVVPEVLRPYTGFDIID
ncbi:MAG: serine--tRNA ligase [Chitinophagales bacterium]